MTKLKIFIDKTRAEAKRVPISMSTYATKDAMLSELLRVTADQDESILKLIAIVEAQSEALKVAHVALAHIHKYDEFNDVQDAITAIERVDGMVNG